jgi:hypothetical protein
VARKEIMKLTSNLPKLFMSLIAMKINRLMYILLEHTKAIGNDWKRLPELNLLRGADLVKDAPENLVIIVDSPVQRALFEGKKAIGVETNGKHCEFPPSDLRFSIQQESLTSVLRLGRKGRDCLRRIPR